MENNKKEQRSNLRNIAIIAHVDHGKTTLVDQLLQQSGTIKKDHVDRVMDSNDLERERGITILAKQTGILYGDYNINIVDTPGHADFGGEVERTLQMVEGFLLLVDAAEGVLPGTKFVLHKALLNHLRPIVMINKIDRKDADIEKTENEIQDLFLELAAHEDQLEFPILYGSSRLGFANYDSTLRTGDMKPLFEAIIKNVPAPENKSEHLRMLVTNLEHSDFLGQIAVGRIFGGSLAFNQQVVCCRKDKVSSPVRITKIFKYTGLDKVAVDNAQFGDIVAISGFEEPIAIGSTICQPEKPDPYPYLSVDEPTLTMYFSVNDSPFSGRDGSFLTSRHLRSRLEKELKTNVALQVESTDQPDVFKVSGRGQLHLGILIENMRREGFELQLSAPEVIYKTIDGVKNEPIEYLMIDLEEAYQGIIMEKLGRRKAQLVSMTPQNNGRVRMEFEIPSRGLIGFRGQFLSDTRGSGIMHVNFLGYEPFKGDIPVRTRGAIVSMEKGTATGYALDILQARGTLFINPGDAIYEGMIIGENSRENDMDVNPCKEKKMSNMRSSGSDDAIKLVPPRIMELESCMEWIRPDELIEVTPNSIRLRKKTLRQVMRKKE
jgi:GTP-binding protein